MAVAKTVTEATNSCRLKLIPYVDEMAELRDRLLTKTVMTKKNCEDSRLTIDKVVGTIGHAIGIGYKC